MKLLLKLQQLSMEGEIEKTLSVFGMMLPGPVKVLLLKMGAEIDRLRADVDKLRSQLHEDGK